MKSQVGDKDAGCYTLSPVACNCTDPASDFAGGSDAAAFDAAMRYEDGAVIGDDEVAAEFAAAAAMAAVAAESASAMPERCECFGCGLSVADDGLGLCKPWLVVGDRCGPGTGSDGDGCYTLASTSCICADLTTVTGPPSSPLGTSPSASAAPAASSTSIPATSTDSNDDDASDEDLDSIAASVPSETRIKAASVPLVVMALIALVLSLLALMVRQRADCLRGAGHAEVPKADDDFTIPQPLPRSAGMPREGYGSFSAAQSAAAAADEATLLDESARAWRAARSEWRAALASVKQSLRPRDRDGGL